MRKKRKNFDINGYKVHLDFEDKIVCSNFSLVRRTEKLPSKVTCKHCLAWVRDNIATIGRATK